MADVPTRRQITLQEAVLWLNDHLGDRVLVCIDVVEGDIMILRLAGVLTHWRNDDDADDLLEHFGAKIIGFHRYRVGGSVFLVPEEDEATFYLVDGDLVVRVGSLSILIEAEEAA